MNVIHENVLVELPEVKQTGVYMPEEEQTKEFVGTVIRYGEAVPEAVQLLLQAKPAVQYSEYFEGKEIVIKGKTYIVMNFKNILIIL